jgi:2-iminobutanoate/2-iminopropanoate deaminase
MNTGPLYVTGARRPVPPYAPAFLAPPFIFVSGCVPLDLDTGASIGDDIEAQTERVLANMARILTEAGATMSDVVKTTVYLTDIALSDGMNAAYARAFGDHRPARATVQIGPLSRAEFLVEIDATAWKKEQ